MMIDNYRYREEMGIFAFEIFHSKDNPDMFEVMMYRFHLADDVWTSDDWLYIHESARVYNSFEQGIQDSRYRLLQYFKGDYYNNDNESLQDWFLFLA